MNYKIIIDAAHGGKDIGYEFDHYKEKDVTLEISNYFYQYFQSKNIPVYLVRNIDETLSIQDRIDKIIASYGDSKQVIVLSNHMWNGEGIQLIHKRYHSELMSFQIEKYLKLHGIKVQRIDKKYPLDVSRDYYPLQREISNMNVFIIKYSVDDYPSILLNQVEKIANAIIEMIGKSESTDILEKQHIIEHTLVKGEDLYIIAQQYRTDIETIMHQNGFRSNLVMEGQVIQIPIDHSFEYIVKPGDNLYQIAKKHGISYVELKNKNHITSQQLVPYQKIII